MPRYQPLRDLLRMEFPWEDQNAFNMGIPGSIERGREAGVLSAMDARTNASLAADLEEANAVRHARDLGFEGSHPLREQAEYNADQKLRQILLPHQMDRDAAVMNLRATQEFNAAQKAMDRQAQMDRLQVAQGGQNTRATERAADIAARAVKPGSNILRTLFGGLIPGVDTNQQVREAEMGRVRDAVRGQMAAGIDAVAMIDPAGRRLRVPADRVEELEAKGARRVE